MGRSSDRGAIPPGPQGLGFPRKRMRLPAALLAIVLCVVSVSATAGLAPAGYWTRLQAATSIREGHGPVAFVVFFDPNCPYCHHLYEQMQPLLAAHPMSVKWIPVGILTMSSFGKAAALLRAHDPLAALAASENGFGPAGGATAPRRATPPVAQALRTNEGLLGAGGAQGVPFVVYRATDGRAHTIMGDPPASALRALLAATPKTKRRTATP